MTRAARSPRPATVARRAAATLIDAAVTLLGIAAAIGGVVAVSIKRAKGDATDATRRWKLELGQRWQLAFQVAGVGLAVRLRNMRGPGKRVLGLRRVDARSGGPVTVGSALRRAAVELALRAAGQSVVRLAGSPASRRATLAARILPGRVLGALPPRRPLIDRLAGTVTIEAP